MSNELEKVFDKIPDVWFDWYARLLPGCSGVFLYLYFSNKIPEAPTGTHVFLFLFSGYILGHILQPLAGLIVKYLEGKVTNEELYTNAKKERDPKVSLLNKVSKAHAEANSMLIFSFVLLLNIIIFWNSTRLNKWLAFGSLVYFVCMFAERVFSRKRKIDDLKPVS